MPDQTSKDIETVARRILAGLARDAVEWDDYPDIGQHDWFRVIERLDGICPEVDDAEYSAAYERLAAREET
jgi:hypothetical protein